MTEVKLAWQVYKFLEEEGFWEQVRIFLSGNKRAEVLIAGSSGVGKTSIAKSLMGLDSFVPVGERSIKEEKFPGTLSGEVLQGNLIDLPVQLITVPGQIEGVFERNRKAVLRKLTRSPNLGIINVVSYGLNELPSASQTEVLTQEGRPKRNFLRKQRELEDKLTREWSNLLCGRDGAAKWVITVMNKADLWYKTDLEEEIQKYYGVNSIA